MAFANPDFVDVVVHSYRHRYGLTAGDPRYQHTEDRIAAQPRIDVPTIVSTDRRTPLTARWPRATPAASSRLLDDRDIDAGHDIPQKRPMAFVEAVMDLSQPNTQ